MFRVPYRWLPRTMWPNLRSLVFDLRHGLYNLWRWLPVIWFDDDYDWDFLARIMEIKFRRLAVRLENGYTLNGPRLGKQARTCAVLLHRLQEERYFENAGYDPETWKAWTSDCAKWIATHAAYMGAQDQRYLGELIGKDRKSTRLNSSHHS